MDKVEITETGITISEITFNQKATVKIVIIIIFVAFTAVNILYGNISKHKTITKIKVHPSRLLAHYINVRDPRTFLITPFPVQSQENKNKSSYFCSQKVKLLILVASAPIHFFKRLAIRATWGNKEEQVSKSFRIVFVLGTTGSSNIQSKISSEADTYDDIVQEDFVDSYHNLTLKSITMLKWINLTCASTLNNDTQHFAPQFMFKTDDDMFINVDILLWIIREAPEQNLVGFRSCGNTPNTTLSSKWYMPKYMYDKSVYPGFLIGWGYLINMRAVPILLATAENTPLIHMEDVYITGIVAGKSKLYPSSSAYFYRKSSNTSDQCRYYASVLTHSIGPRGMQYVWENRFYVSLCTDRFQDAVIDQDSESTKKTCMFI